MIAAACGGGGGGGGGGGNATGAVKKGGTFRLATEDFGFTGAFDPTDEYLGEAWGMYTNLLLRTLLTYKHIPGPEGLVLVPDLAKEVPQPTDGGKTYTFHLKDGIKFGPPVNREITSKDVLYAFQRIACKTCGAEYGFYYDIIKGLHSASMSGTPGNINIPGIETPDDKTIVFHLTQPAGDFLYRLAMPATAPIPQEVAKCFTKAGDYGRYVIASGPYMLAGSDQLNIKNGCSGMKPISGYDPSKKLDFVRNPKYDPSTDSPEVRENNVDEVTIEIDTNTKDIFNRVQQGNLDGEISHPPSDVIAQYSTNSQLKPNLHSNPGDRTWYITINLTQPPFDDIHVRKAMNYVMDKDAMRKAWGGPVGGDIATHIMPPTLTGGHPTGSEYNPYAGPTGDLQKAMAEMKQSKYDHNHDGKCDDPACDNLLFINRGDNPVWTDMEPAVVASAKKIGINLSPRDLATSAAYTTIQTVNKNVPIALNAGWGKDYPDPYTFVYTLFSSSSILCQGNVNYSLVGLTPAKAKECGATGSINNVPSADKELSKCLPLTGDARTNCWIDDDKFIMENIVPWVPYLWSNVIQTTGPAVTKYVYDQFSDTWSYSHIAVDASKQ
jgi:peptide/nickel transport system substrate-binding protein